MTASLGGLDALILTAGVGEHAMIVRAEVCKGLSFLGLGISKEKTMGAAGDFPLETLCDRNISSGQAVVPTLVIHIQEDWQIAKQYWQL